MNLLNFNWYSLLLKAAIVGLIFFTGMAVGNNRATQHFLADQQKRADEEYAQATSALAEEANRRDSVAEEAVKRAITADQRALEALAVVGDAIQRGDQALAQIKKDQTVLAKSKETIDGLMAVNSMLAGPIDLRMVICGSADTRRLLDAIVTPGETDHPTPAGTPEAGSAGGASGSALPIPETPNGLILTCDQAMRGLVLWAGDDAKMRAFATAWQAWYRAQFP